MRARIAARALLFLSLLPAAPAATLRAQSVTVTGRLVHGGADSTPLAGRWVVLHQVTVGSGGPVDSTRTDRSGRYVLRVARVDTSAVYVVSGWYQGIAYFSQPVQVVGTTRASVEPLVVYDTSTTGPPIRVARRLVTVAQPKRDGTRDILEILQLENPGTTTRIASDTARPTWAGAIPREAIQFQAGQGDLSPQAVARRGDSVAVFGPLAPGVAKQVSYAYVLPASVRRLSIPIDQWTGEVDLLLEDTAAVVTAKTVEALGVERIEQRTFARYRMNALEPGAGVTITLPQGPFRVQALLPVVVGLVALALGVGLVVALRKGP